MPTLTESAAEPEAVADSDEEEPVLVESEPEVAEPDEEESDESESEVEVAEAEEPEAVDPEDPEPAVAWGVPPEVK